MRKSRGERNMIGSRANQGEEHRLGLPFARQLRSESCQDAQSLGLPWRGSTRPCASCSIERPSGRRPSPSQAVVRVKSLADRRVTGDPPCSSPRRRRSQAIRSICHGEEARDRARDSKRMRDACGPGFRGTFRPVSPRHSTELQVWRFR